MPTEQHQPLDSATGAFIEACLGRNLRPDEQQRFEQLWQLLAAANQTTNLTRIKSPHDYWIRHLCDSLALARVERIGWERERRVVDVGCGAGFPLLPLAIVRPNWQLTGVESKQRKAAFVESAAKALGLVNCRALARRAREAARLPAIRHQFDLVVARAVSGTAELIRECRALLREDPSSAMVLYKTPDAVQDEWDAGEREAAKVGWQLQRSDPFELPHGQGTRQFVIARR